MDIENVVIEQAYGTGKKNKNSSQPTVFILQGQDQCFKKLQKNQKSLDFSSLRTFLERQ